MDEAAKAGLVLDRSTVSFVLDCAEKVEHCPDAKRYLKLPGTELKVSRVCLGTFFTTIVHLEDVTFTHHPRSQ